jgi:hypothetical protein
VAALMVRRDCTAGAGQGLHRQRGGGRGRHAGGEECGQCCLAAFPGRPATVLVVGQDSHCQAGRRRMARVAELDGEGCVAYEHGDGLPRGLRWRACEAGAAEPGGVGRSERAGAGAQQDPRCGVEERQDTRLDADSDELPGEDLGGEQPVAAEAHAWKLGRQCSVKETLIAVFGMGMLTASAWIERRIDGVSGPIALMLTRPPRRPHAPTMRPRTTSPLG